MLSDKPLIGHTYIHTKSGNEYEVIALGAIKSPNDNQWYNGVFYQRTDGTPGTYARTTANFENNFEDIKDTVET